MTSTGDFDKRIYGIVPIDATRSRSRANTCRTAARHHDHLRLPRIGLEDELDLASGSAPRCWRSCRTGGLCRIPRLSVRPWPIAAVDPQRPWLLGRPDHPRHTGRPGRHRSSRAPRIGGRSEALRRLAGRGRRHLPGGPSRRPVGPAELGTPARLPGSRPARTGRPCHGKQGRRLRREHAAGRPPRQPDGRAVRARFASSTSRLALALDTGHAHISAELPRRDPAAGALLATTHVHDNNGRQDTHDRPRPGHDRLGCLGQALWIVSVIAGRSCWSVSASFETTPHCSDPEACSLPVDSLDSGSA